MNPEAKFDHQEFEGEFISGPRDTSVIDQKPPLTKTPEQLHIIDLATQSHDNLIINAYAGTGKTTALEMICEYLPPDNPVLYLVFNKRNREEAEERFSNKISDGIRLPPLSIKTLNGFGYGIWRTDYPGPPDPNKTRNILKEIASDLPRAERTEVYDHYQEILSAIGLAKSFGYIPEGKFTNAKRLIDPETFFAQLDEAPSDLFREIVDAILITSIKAAYGGNIDFDDQVYMPTLFGGSFPRFPTVILDEFQDFNAVCHEMLTHLRGSRIIAVGDPFQSIYGFRGAVQGGMAKAREQFQMREASLSVCFRCPQAIVENARWRVPNLKWTKHGGSTGQLHNLKLADLPDDCAIICRNNAPLFALALRLLSSGHSVNVRGSDLGPKIVGIMRKLGPETMIQGELFNAIESWRQEKLERESKTADDIADCMRVFAGAGDTLRQAIAYAEDLFRQSGTINLTTGHKAKGLEWDVVYHLDPWIIGESEQELNLRYVIQTRAKQAYYEVDTVNIR